MIIPLGLKDIHLGDFKDINHAILARQEAERIYYATN